MLSTARMSVEADFSLEPPAEKVWSTPQFQPVIPRAENPSMPCLTSDLQEQDLISGCCFRLLNLLCSNRKRIHLLALALACFASVVAQVKRKHDLLFLFSHPMSISRSSIKFFFLLEENTLSSFAKTGDRDLLKLVSDESFLTLPALSTALDSLW